MHNKNKIIVALDVDNEAAVHEIVTDLGSSVNVYKVGKELFVSEGLNIVMWLKELGKKVFLDLKFHDTQNTVAKAAKAIVRRNIDIFTIHASGGKSMMEATVKAVREEAERMGVIPPKILAVTVLTSMSKDDLNSISIELEPAEQVRTLAKLAKESGVDGIVCSPLEIEIVREVIGDDMIIVTPGIRPSFASYDDQKRVMTPGEAVSKGADYLVIGRPIVQANNRQEAANKLLEEIKGAW